jgi:hypothetical protein
MIVIEQINQKKIDSSGGGGIFWLYALAFGIEKFLRWLAARSTSRYQF